MKKIFAKYIWCLKS